MTKSTLFLFITAILLWGCGKPRTKPPVVENGVLDLTEWNFERDGYIALNGDWAFYWNNLYSPEDFKQDTLLRMTGFCSVPGYWSQQKIGDQYLPGQGFATYRIKIRTNTPDKLLALKLLDASSSYKLFINGEFVAGNGVVSPDPEKAKPQFVPKERTFTKSSDELDVVMQVANNFHSKGGIWSEIIIGNQEQVMALHDYNAFSDLFIMGAVFILFIYHVWIYLFRKSEYAVFWFGMTCLSLLVRSSVTSERFLFVLFPSFDPGIGLKLEYLTICGSSLSWAMFLYYLFPKDFSETVLRIIIAIVVIEVLIILGTSDAFYSGHLIWLQLSVIIMGIYFNGVALISTIRGRHGGLYILLSILIIFSCLINDILYSRLIINTAFIIPYGFFLALLSQAYLLSSRISLAFNTAEQLTVNLEIKVKERTFLLAEEKKKSDDLLLNILPEEIAEELKENGVSKARHYNDVTVLFTDFVGFTTISQQLSPTELVEEIHKNFTAFDAIIGKHKLEKIKTIGDAYMAVCGLPNESIDHAQRVVNAALDIQTYMNQNGNKFQIRIGINSGAVVAGIVGVKKYAYDIWGDTVNTAARMEQNSEAGKINISGSTFELIKDEYDFEHRGKIKAKNKGEVDMYFVNSRKDLNLVVSQPN
jgi:class 3 adenylate cyclase